MNCPACRSPVPAGADACDQCGATVRRQNARQSHSEAVETRRCAFNDFGHGCGERGILSSALTGSGQWYCRQHWSALNGWPVAGLVGNAVPEWTRSMGALAWEKSMVEYLASGRRSAAYELEDGQVKAVKGRLTAD